MYNVIILEKNFQKIEKIINIVSIEKNFIRILNVASNYKSFVEYLIEYDYDIIIVNESFVNNVIDFLKEKELFRYKNSVIVLCENKTCSITSDIFLFENVFFISKLENTLIRIINYKNGTNMIKEKIQSELKCLSFNYSYVGTRYIEDIIFEIYKMKDYFNGNLKKEIYPIIARRYNKSIDSIYGAVKLSTKNMLLDCKEDTITKYFNYNNFIIPKIKEIIIVVLNKL